METVYVNYLLAARFRGLHSYGRTAAQPLVDAGRSKIECWHAQLHLAASKINMGK